MMHLKEGTEIELQKEISQNSLQVIYCRFFAGVLQLVFTRYLQGICSQEAISQLFQ